MKPRRDARPVHLYRWGSKVKTVCGKSLSDNPTMRVTDVREIVNCTPCYKHANLGNEYEEI